MYISLIYQMQKGLILFASVKKTTEFNLKRKVDHLGFIPMFFIFVL